MNEDLIDLRLVTVPQAARLLGRPERTVFRWAAKGLIPTRMIGKVRMIRLTDLDAIGELR
ncbi:helix-turn-helix domain-containing protein [Tsukamurella tyrosinosolvens]|uniref:helix-turn-helix domain-containing protein n=1 Tax=Tsukamurella tyrosinosolvens TaxID=57704 RepID=UPI002DD430E7|nr:helix-turn-helix domain-containing protein [Tsukamurella tyrosinosolvens]MEC4614021.1 helix-turn-helix domain-containing protein [Tsukamurella tyrosinosolvens]